MMLLPGSFYTAAVVVLAWIAATISRPKAKRAAGLALINAICNTRMFRYTPFVPRPSTDRIVFCS